MESVCSVMTKSGHGEQQAGHDSNCTKYTEQLNTGHSTAHTHREQLSERYWTCHTQND